MGCHENSQLEPVLEFGLWLCEPRGWACGEPRGWACGEAFRLGSAPRSE